MSNPKTFGWNAVKLSAHSYADLEVLRQSVLNDPKSANPAHAAGKSIHLYTPSARKKFDALAWAIFYKKQEAARAAAT